MSLNPILRTWQRLSRSLRDDKEETMTARLPDPVVDTPMIVTLDELRAYEYDPRVNRNPMYD